MKNLQNSLKDYVDSGDYFSDAMSWYKQKYINPFSHRSFVAIIFLGCLLLFLGTIVDVNELFPIVTPVKYTIKADSFENKNARITHATHINNDPLASITDILVKNYVSIRESYNYEKLKKQFTFVKNNSTRIVFRKFYSSMELDNPSSPLVLYQKNATRKVEIISTNYPEPYKAIVKYRFVAENKYSSIIDEKILQATIYYEIDKINLNLEPGSRFNFTITGYQSELLEDKQVKKQ